MNLRLAFLNAVIFLTLFTNLALAQDFKVSGKVRNKSNGEVLNGATITIKGTATAVATDAMGQFSISVPEKGAVLLFTYTGFKTVTYPVKNKMSNIDILMEDAIDVYKLGSNIFQYFIGAWTLAIAAGIAFGVVSFVLFSHSLNLFT